METRKIDGNRTAITQIIQVFKWNLKVEITKMFKNKIINVTYGIPNAHWPLIYNHYITNVLRGAVAYISPSLLLSLSYLINPLLVHSSNVIRCSVNTSKLCRCFFKVQPSNLGTASGHRGRFSIETLHVIIDVQLYKWHGVTVSVNIENCS